MQRCPAAARVILVAAVILALEACASRRGGPLPALEDYSDGVSGWAADFLEDWKSEGSNAGLYAPDFAWKGALPGESLVAAASRPPLTIGIFRAAAPPSTSATSGGSGAFRERLRQARSRFSRLGRTDARKRVRALAE
ncbi:MAG: hypothetical protein ABI682_14075, partial [Acidobacteriota bacterium]